MVNPFFCLVCGKKINQHYDFKAITCSGACRKKKCLLYKKLVKEKYPHHYLK